MQGTVSGPLQRWRKPKTSTITKAEISCVRVLQGLLPGEEEWSTTIKGVWLSPSFHAYYVTLGKVLDQPKSQFLYL